MISHFINFLKNDLNAFIKIKKGLEHDFVLFANLNTINESAQGSDNKVIISIVNIEEEKLLQDPSNYVKGDKTVTYKQPPIWLNFICLFTFYSKNSENYDGIDLLTHVVQYFQSRPRMDKKTAVEPGHFPNELESLRAEFVSLNYEQTNYLWGLFGGKYQPSLVYKLKAIPIDNEDLVPGLPILTAEVIAKHRDEG